MKLKQLFCKHIWKHTDQELIDTRLNVIGNYVTKKKLKYANTWRCIKCEKVKIDTATVTLPSTPQDVIDYYFQK